MTTPQTPDAPRHRRNGNLQTKALAGLVAVMVAAAIVALVFVTSSGGKSNDKQAGGQPSDVGRNSSVSAPKSSPATKSSAPTSAAPTSTAPTSTTPTNSASSAADTTSASTGSSSTVNSSSHSADAKKVVYTVKKGDTLTDIGRWYSDHGYLKLYDWNKSVIGQNPDLIFPGQKIIVVDGTVGVARHSH